MTLNLNPRPDGWGFLYGTFTGPDGSAANVNVMPPKGLWDGDLVLPGYEPHARDWAVFLDGEEVGRVQRIDDVAGLLRVLPH